MALSLILPLIIIPVEWPAKLIPADPFPNAFLMQTEPIATAVVHHHPNSIQADTGISILNMILFIAFIVYVVGVSYKSYLFAKNLIKMKDFIKKSSKVKEGNYWIVCLKSEIPAFSFFNYIFINNTYKNLFPDELHVIKEHEMVHAKQYHTFDILFAELVAILFWFNPVVNYLKRSLKEIHEYIVDEKIAGHGETKKAYARLLLTLASDTKVFDLAASFTGEYIKRRIQMLAKPRTSPGYKLMYLILVPLTAMLLVSFSYLKNPKADSIRRSEQKEVAGIAPELKKYCGIYFPSKRDINFGLKPMEIILKDNKLFANGTVALHFESDSIFSYTYNGARSIKFDLDSKKEVTGCVLIKFVTKEQANYLVLEGEYLKGKQ
jgi:beta-lactamase regulating signal transducer with metallopeptidase domain